ncbi:MAG: serine hydrolase, partial [Planctomycetota bacterium]
MRKVVILLALAAALAVVAIVVIVSGKKTPWVGGRTNAEIAERLDAFLVEQADAGFAGVALIVRGDDVLLRKGYGLADRENDVPFGDETVFTVGSITKQFTGAAIIEARRGQLDHHRRHLAQVLRERPSRQAGHHRPPT